MGSPPESAPAIAAAPPQAPTHDAPPLSSHTDDTAPAGPASAAVEPGAALEIDFDVTVVDGEAGRRLGVLQAEVILDVLTWLHEHRHSAGPTS